MSTVCGPAGVSSRGICWEVRGSQAGAGGSRPYSLCSGEGWLLAILGGSSSRAVLPVLLAARETLPCNQGRGRRRDLSHLTQLPSWSVWAGAPGSPQGLCAGPAATLVPPGPGYFSPAPDSPPPVPGQSHARAFSRGQGVGPKRFTHGERVPLLLEATCVLNAGHRSGLGRGSAGRQPEASGNCAFIPGMQDGQSWLRLEGVSQTHHLKRGVLHQGLWHN